MRRSIRAALSVCVALATFAQAEESTAASYFRIAPLAGGAYDPYTFTGFGVPDLNQCFDWSGAGIIYKPRDSGGGAPCNLAVSDPKPWWQVSVPTNNSNLSQTVYFWVQGYRPTSGQSVCFRAWTYSQFGGTYAGTGDICVTGTGNYDIPLGAVTIPSYGNAFVIGSFSNYYFQGVSGNTWTGVAWNYTN